jgi:uncharacterized protein YggE
MAKNSAVRKIARGVFFKAWSLNQLASGFNSKLGPVYSVRYHVSNYQPSPMVRMMKADAAPVSAQETYEQPTIQFDDQVDVVFQLEPAQGQQQDTAAKAQ